MSPRASDSEGLLAAHSAIRAFWEQEGARYDHKDAHGIFSEDEHRRWTTALGAIPPSSRARHFIWTLLEPEKAFAEWHRVLAPGGTLIADCSLNTRVALHHYSDDVAAALPFSAIDDPAPVADALRAVGFSAVDVEIVSGDEQRRRAVLRAKA